MIDQDLIISRTLVEIFSDDFLASELAFNGGTALHKLYLNPQLRSLEKVLEFFPSHVTVQEEHHNTLLFHINSDTPPIVPYQLRIEINNFDHFNELGTVKIPYAIKNKWFSGQCFLTTYHLSEILGMKLCSLYQQKRGRDLFDLYEAFINAEVDADEIIHCFKWNMKLALCPIPTRKEFIHNLKEKLNEPEFLSDIQHLVNPSEEFTPQKGYKVIRKELISRLS